MNASSILFAACAALGLVLAQFAFAGLALYAFPVLWAAHGVVGFTVALPLGWLLCASFRSAVGRELRQATAVASALYVLQIVFVVLSEQPGLIALRSAHVANAGLFVCSVVALALRAWSDLRGQRQSRSLVPTPGLE